MIYTCFYLNNEEPPFASMHLRLTPHIGEHMIFHGKRHRVVDVEYCTDGNTNALSRINIELVECIEL